LASVAGDTRIVPVERAGPFLDIARHIQRATRTLAAQEGAYRCRRRAGPGLDADLARVVHVSPGIEVRLLCPLVPARRLFPLRLCGQSPGLTGEMRKPVGVCKPVVPTDHRHRVERLLLLCGPADVPLERIAQLRWWRMMPCCQDEGRIFHDSDRIHRDRNGFELDLRAW